MASFFCSGIIPKSGIEPALKGSPSLWTYAQQVRYGTIYCFKLLLLFDCLMRPLFKFRLPSLLDPLRALRTAVWLSLAGSISTLGAWCKFSNAPYLTTFVRCIIGALGSLTAVIMDRKTHDGMVTFLAGQATHIVLGNLAACSLSWFSGGDPTQHWRHNFISGAVAILFPAIGALHWAEETPLASLLLKPLSFSS